MITCRASRWSHAGDRVIFDCSRSKDALAGAAAGRGGLRRRRTCVLVRELPHAVTHGRPRARADRESVRFHPDDASSPWSRDLSGRFRVRPRRSAATFGAMPAPALHATCATLLARIMAAACSGKTAGGTAGGADGPGAPGFQQGADTDDAGTLAVIALRVRDRGVQRAVRPAHSTDPRRARPVHGSLERRDDLRRRDARGLPDRHDDLCRGRHGLLRQRRRAPCRRWGGTGKRHD